MEIAALTAFLAPFLPYLVRAGERAAGAAADALGDQAGGFAKAIWERLKPGVEERPAAKEAAEDVAANPDDEDAVAALRLQLRKLVEEDEELARDLTKLWQEAQAANVITVTASGERSVAVGGSVKGSTIVTGDQREPQSRPDSGSTATRPPLPPDSP
jgi:hypothetical protein